MMEKRKTTNILLLIIALPVFFYILKTLSFIFIPLLFSMFIALLFLPLMRWLRKKKVPKVISLLLVLLIIGVFIKITAEVIQVSSKEIMNSEKELLVKAESKLEKLLIPLENTFGINRVGDERGLRHYISKINFTKTLGSGFNFLSNTVSMLFMILFFTILLLGESFNFQKILNNTLIAQKISSIKIFMRIEKDLLTFLKVKIFVSLLTGMGFTLACYFFDISFPIFWGLFAFLINFVQMIGSIISVLLLSMFAFVELDSVSTLLFFILTISLIQAILGGILEPIFMGKSFVINVITILIVLMFWSYIWGIPGLILAIPITVFLKIMFEQFQSTKIIAKLMEGSELIKIKGN